MASYLGFSPATLFLAVPAIFGYRRTAPVSIFRSERRLITTRSSCQPGRAVSRSGHHAGIGGGSVFGTRRVAAPGMLVWAESGLRVATRALFVPRRVQGNLQLRTMSSVAPPALCRPRRHRLLPRRYNCPRQSEPLRGRGRTLPCRGYARCLRVACHRSRPSAAPPLITEAAGTDASTFRLRTLRHGVSENRRSWIVSPFVY